MAKGRRISPRTLNAKQHRKFPDCHGPVQGQSEPYRRLWAAVLAQAMWDLKKTAQAQQTGSFFLHDPIGWFRSDQEHVGSFVWICLVMGLVPDLTRERLSGMFKLPLGSDSTEDTDNTQIRTLGKMPKKAMGTRRSKERKRPDVRKAS